MSARYVQPLRILIQFSFLLFSCWLAFGLYSFFQHLLLPGSVPVGRPGGVEAFLPISGLLGVVAWLRGLGINPIHPAAVVVFLTVLALSLLLRRSFCSWICPVATISECSWKAGFRFLRRNLRLPVWPDRLLRLAKYLLLLFFLGSTAAMDTAALQSFIFSDYHKIADFRLLNFFLQISPAALTVILVILAISLLLRNPFCRYLCPYGALLGLVAQFSPVRVTRDRERCVSCGVCSQVCPSRIDVMHMQSVNSPECIGCWRCVSLCRTQGALAMRAFERIAIFGGLFALLVVLIFWGGTAMGKTFGHWYNAVSIDEYRMLLR